MKIVISFWKTFVFIDNLSTFHNRHFFIKMSLMQFICASSFIKAIFLFQMLSICIWSSIHMFFNLLFWFAITVTIFANSFNFSTHRKFRLWNVLTALFQRSFENSVENFQQHWFENFLVWAWSTCLLCVSFRRNCNKFFRL